MTKTLSRVAFALAGAAISIGLGAGVAHAKPVKPGGTDHHHGCVMYNGTVLADGQSYTTSAGTTITCIDGFVCRTLASGKDIPCRIESGTTPSRSVDESGSGGQGPTPPSPGTAVLPRGDASAIG